MDGNSAPHVASWTSLEAIICDDGNKERIAWEPSLVSNLTLHRLDRQGVKFSAAHSAQILHEVSLNY